MEELIINLLNQLGVEGGVITAIIAMIGAIALKIKEAIRTKKIAKNVENIDEVQSLSIKKQGERIDLLEVLIENAVTQQSEHINLLETTIENQNKTIDSADDKLLIISKELQNITKLAKQNR